MFEANELNEMKNGEKHCNDCHAIYHQALKEAGRTCNDCEDVDSEDDSDEEQLHECVHCDTTNRADQMELTEDGWICKDCQETEDDEQDSDEDYDETMLPCEECSDLCKPEDLKNEGGRRLCNNCIEVEEDDKDTLICPLCCEDFERKDGKEDGAQLICKECHESLKIEREEGVPVCDNCLNRTDTTDEGWTSVCLYCEKTFCDNCCGHDVQAYLLCKGCREAKRDRPKDMEDHFVCDACVKERYVYCHGCHRPWCEDHIRFSNPLHPVMKVDTKNNKCCKGRHFKTEEIVDKCLRCEPFDVHSQEEEKPKKRKSDDESTDEDTIMKKRKKSIPLDQVIDCDDVDDKKEEKVI
jgi:hypothetical protein